MSRSVSTAFRTAAYAREAGPALFLELLVIEEDSLDEPIRVVNDTVSTSSGGYTYTAFPFQIDFPADSPNELPTVRLQISNVSPTEIAAALRSVTGRPTVTLYLVLASSPDTIEQGPIVMSMANVSITDMFVTSSLGGEDMLNTRYPKDLITPQTLPGLF